MTSPKPFLRKKGNYRDLYAYQKAEAIYDMTYFFINKFLKKSDRTVDQMLQAARSGKQNIAEGSVGAMTSSETEIKLTNVAKASLQELLVDYEDYLRTRGLQIWPSGDARRTRTTDICRRHNDSAFFMDRIDERSDESIANIVITLIHQTDRMLARLIDNMQREFVANGGIREQMTRARLNHRNGKGEQ